MSSFTVYTNNSIYKVELCGGAGEEREQTVRNWKQKAAPRGWMEWVGPQGGWLPRAIP